MPRRTVAVSRRVFIEFTVTGSTRYAAAQAARQGRAANGGPSVSPRLAKSVAATVTGLWALLVAGCGEGEPVTRGDRGPLTPFGESRIASLVGVGEVVDAESFSLLVAEQASLCLRQRGFDLQASDLVASSTGTAEEIDLAQRQLSEWEFAEQFGFGIAAAGIRSFGQPAPLPIDAYLSSLGTAEAQALADALYGTGAETGCLQQASDMARQQFQQPRFQLYGLYSTDVEDRVFSDPRVLALLSEYAACMASSGFSYQSPPDAQNAAARRFEQWTQTAEFTNPEAREISERLSTESAVSFDDLLQQEIREAVLSLECEAPIRSELVRVWDEIESAWIEENAEKIANDLADLN